jgi:hypothetical protein
VLVAVHQPNFFPWLGFFDKIRRADVFVFLDGVDYPRSGSKGMGSWTNRVRIAINGEAHWLTCPVRRMPLGTPIAAIQINDDQPWRAKLLRTLEVTYRRSPGFQRAMDLLAPLVTSQEAALAPFNMTAVTAIAAHLGLSCRFVRQTDQPHVGSATQLLASLVTSVGGSAYLAGGGAQGYQEDDVFTGQGLGVVYQRYSPLLYGREERFIPGLSVIDYLMEDGRPLAEAFPS